VGPPLRDRPRRGRRLYPIMADRVSAVRSRTARCAQGPTWCPSESESVRRTAWTLVCRPGGGEHMKLDRSIRPPVGPNWASETRQTSTLQLGTLRGTLHRTAERGSTTCSAFMATKTLSSASSSWESSSSIQYTRAVRALPCEHCRRLPAPAPLHRARVVCGRHRCFSLISGHRRGHPCL
jgi:hypothetical protein